MESDKAGTSKEKEGTGQSYQANKHPDNVVLVKI